MARRKPRTWDDLTPEEKRFYGSFSGGGVLRARPPETGNVPQWDEICVRIQGKHPHSGREGVPSGQSVTIGGVKMLEVRFDDGDGCYVEPEKLLVVEAPAKFKHLEGTRLRTPRENHAQPH